MPTKITVRPNGPLRIEGDFEISDQTGASYDLAGRAVISLCRCGQSSNRPFCDGTHGRVGFECEPKARALPPPQPKP